MELTRLQNQQKEIKQSIKIQKGLMHDGLKIKYHKLIRGLDILFIICILMNMGAIAITNATVVKHKPDIELFEANPVVAEKTDFKSIDNYYEEQGKPKGYGNKLFYAILTNFYVYMLLITFYIHSRMKFYRKDHITALVVFVLAMFFMLGMDFMNDAGFWLGRLIWGV